MTTRCSGCGKDITNKESEKRFVPCGICHRHTPKGADNYKKNDKNKKDHKIKGGKNGKTDNEAYALAGNGWDVNIVSKIFKKMIK